MEPTAHKGNRIIVRWVKDDPFSLMVGPSKVVEQARTNVRQTSPAGTSPVTVNADMGAATLSRNPR